MKIGNKLDDKGGEGMIIFSTKFYVNQELTMEKFIELAFEWVNGSPHYGFNSICWNGEPLYEIETEKQKLSIVQSIDKQILALRLERLHLYSGLICKIRSKIMKK